nr:PfkB [Kibdelosporangium sp. MJ126-NF4]
MPKIVVAGVVNIRSALAVDAFPVSLVSSVCRADTISIRLSGSGFTVARTVQRLGSEVRFATYAGNDSLGRMVIGDLRRTGLHGPGVLLAGDQARSIVLFDRDGTRSSTSDLRSTPRLRYPRQVFARLLDTGCDLAVLTNISFTRPLIPVAVDRGIPIATDLHVVADMAKPHNQEWMRSAHVLAGSHEQLPVGPADWVRALWARYGTEICLIGCGGQGAVLGVRGKPWHIEAVAPRGVRYTGSAGDVLLGSFVHHYVSSGDPLAAARYAVVTAGWWVGGLPEDCDGPSAAVVADLVASYGLPVVTRLR